MLAFLLALPLMLALEGNKLGELYALCQKDEKLVSSIFEAGLWFYIYNELATITIKKTSAVTMSVANTAKRVIVIVGVALALGESLPFLKLVGCGIGIGGVFLYSVIDQLLGIDSAH